MWWFVVVVVVVVVCVCVWRGGWREGKKGDDLAQDGFEGVDAAGLTAGPLLAAVHARAVPQLFLSAERCGVGATTRAHGEHEGGPRGGFGPVAR